MILGLLPISCASVTGIFSSRKQGATMPLNSCALKLFLQRLLSHSVLGSEESDAILGLRGQVSRIRAHRDIVPPGQTTNHAYLIIEGIAGRFGQLVDGRRQITAFHFSGDMCDLHSIVFPKIGWSIQALTTTSLLKVSHQDLRRVAIQYPAIAEAFWRDCVADASILSQWVINVGRRNARTRLAHMICEMAVRMEHAGRGSRTNFELDVTQQHLGDALGLTSVHVNRMAQSLRRDNLISTHAREVRIPDWDRMAKMADFNETYLATGRKPSAVLSVIAGAH